MNGAEGGLSPEHRAGDGEQAVRDRAQSPAVAVSAGAEGGVLGLADGVMLDGDPCPVVDCIAEARMGCEAANEGREDLKRRFEILTSIPGVANVTAAGLIAHMPEFGTLTGPCAASLAGLAPVTRESGAWKGRSFIQGGREKVRQLLYMPAMAAIRCNPDLRRSTPRCATPASRPTGGPAGRSPDRSPRASRRPPQRLLTHGYCQGKAADRLGRERREHRPVSAGVVAPACMEDGTFMANGAGHPAELKL